MASITFVDYETIIPAAWLNEVNLAVFGLMGDGTNAPTTIADAATNLGVLQVINDLSDLNDPAAARINLGVDAAGADTAYNFRANNLSDVADAALARGNIGAGTPGFGDATSLAPIVPVNGADNENTHSTPLFVSVVITLTVGDSPAFPRRWTRRNKLCCGSSRGQQCCHYCNPYPSGDSTPGIFLAP